VRRSAFFEPEDLIRDAGLRVKQLRRSGGYADYLTFVSDGEPTLDKRLGSTIHQMKNLGIKIAVFTNGSLLWRKDVREDLKKADLVSVKIDSVMPLVWEWINRPHCSLKLERILEGILKFAGEYRGKLLTETMLVRTNVAQMNIRYLREFLARVKPARVCLSAITRPPAEVYAKPCDAEFTQWACDYLREKIKWVDIITGSEGTDFFVPNTVEDLLNITAVHPIRKDAVEALLKQAPEKRAVLQKMIYSGALREKVHEGEKFYTRVFSQGCRQKDCRDVLPDSEGT